MLFDLLSFLTVFDWPTPLVGNIHNAARLPDDIQNVLRGKPLSEHTLFVENASFGAAKDTLAGLGIGQICVDIYFRKGNEWSVLVPTAELQSISEAFYRAGINYRS